MLKTAPKQQNSSDCVLGVLFKPGRHILPPGAAILSFLSPADERGIKRERPMIYGRIASQSVRNKAIHLYRDLVAEIGIFQMPDRRTFRQTMKKGDGASPWWYHPVSFRDPEGDPAFNRIIAVLTIQKTAEELDARSLLLYGAEPCLAKALRLNYNVQEINPDQDDAPASAYLYGISSRLKYLRIFYRHLKALGRHYQLPAIRHYDLVFSGFWDWSFWRNEKTGGFEDRYFKNLFRNLEARQLKSVGYFAWFDADIEPDKKGRPLSSVLAPLRDSQDVVILQAHLTISDAMRALLDLRPFKAYRRASGLESFRKIFQRDSIDWFPLFETVLLKGFLGSQIPHYTLVAEAAKAAALRYMPHLTLSFLEHFPHSRAFYEGVRNSGHSIACWAVQHAACNHEKTFYYLHSEIEFKGSPDGCAVPHPHKFFVMGKLGQTIVKECGYTDDQVCLTGSTRYDHIRMPVHGIRKPRDRTRNKTILVVCSLDLETELPMVEAISIAAKTLPGLHLRIRNHPFARVDHHPRYKQLHLDIEISDASLEDDLANCDLILFSYSTVAEEAFIKGVPVWQWLPRGFNGSALSEVMDIPRFGSVPSLQAALENFCDAPDGYVPTAEMIQDVAEQIFYPADGRASEHIAGKCERFLHAGHHE